MTKTPVQPDKNDAEISDKLKSDKKTTKIDSAEGNLLAGSEDYYKNIVDRIYVLSESHLQKQAVDKKDLRSKFYWVFSPLLILQFVVIIALIVLNGLCIIKVDNTVLTVLASAMFVETLGIMTVMIKYCFDSKQEVKILEVLNNIVANFQKFRKNKSDNEEDKERK